MKIVNSILKEEEHKLKRIVKQATERLRTAPKGFLRIANKSSGIEYYYKSVETCGGNGRYMKKDEYGLARKLAQRDYDTQVVKAAEERIKAIKNFLQIYERTDLREIYIKTNQYRRELIDTFIVSDEEYIKHWQTIKYEGKLVTDDEKEIITERRL